MINGNMDISKIYIQHNELEKLEKENKELKEKLDISETNYDILYNYFSQINEILDTELIEESIEKISQLKKENKELKMQLFSPDTTETTCPNCGEKYYINYCRLVFDLKQENEKLKKINGTLQNSLLLIRQKYNKDKARYRRKYQKERNIQNEFEKWLEWKIKRAEVSDEYVNGILYEKYHCGIYQEVLDKLQELKEIIK